MTLRSLEVVSRLVDEGSFHSWDEPTSQTAPPADHAYRAALADARASAGTDESVLTGEGTIRGHRVALLVSEFAFLAGSVGLASAERLTRAVESATRQGLPLIALPASGGTRVQEGAEAFVQMIKITAAIAQHKAAGLPYIVYLRNPTFGGVLASWGSLAHITLAEPGARVGFLGARIVRAMGADPLAPDVQTSERLHASGVVDAVIHPEALHDFVGSALDIICRSTVSSTDGRTARSWVSRPDAETEPPVDPWRSVEYSRASGRPRPGRLLATAAHQSLTLVGESERDGTVGVSLCAIGAVSCVAITLTRSHDVSTSLGPAALRTVQRGIALALDLGLPLVTVIDSSGTVPTADDEQGGLAREIARCLEAMVTVPIPTVTVLLGQGCGGTALALLPSDWVIAAQHSWLSPLPLEGMSDLLYGDTSHASVIAKEQGIASLQLRHYGVVDHIIPEYPQAALEPEAFCLRAAEALQDALLSLTTEPTSERLARRTARHRALGTSDSQHWQRDDRGVTGRRHRQGRVPHEQCP